MTPSRLAFVQEFERELGSISLRDWFGALRDQEPSLGEFADPNVLRRFLHDDDVDARKPEVWRALVSGVTHSRSAHATTYVLGLLEPSLGRLVDEFDSGSFDPEDLWQEAVRGALRALRNPRLPERKEVLAGLARDTRKHLCAWLRLEITKQEREASLQGQTYETKFEEVLDGVDGEALLADWCRRARISSDDASVISTTRIAGRRLTELAPVHSAPYERLKKRRNRAEERLKFWLNASKAGLSQNRMSQTGP
jgi:DNA-directed RNA polymerase specialized sigma24 family protein